MVSTSSRRITRLTWLMLCLPGSVHGAETRELLTGLREPVAIATSPAAAGGVLIVERGARAVTLWDAKNGESELISEPPEKLADKALSPTAVSYLSDQAFVVAWGGGESNTAAIALYTLGADDQKPSAVVGSVRRLGEDELPRDQGTVRTLARGERFLYATAGASPSTVLRARHNSGLLSKFRPITEVPGTVASIAESPRGYLTAVVDGGIEFFEASAASGGTLARYQTGLVDVTAVAYGTVPRPIDRLLYVLGSGKPTPQSQGVYRIDAAVDDSGHPAAAATPIAEANNLRSMAFTADGRLLLLQAGPSTTGGRLLEVDQPL